jgi:DNA adenine methylase
MFVDPPYYHKAAKLYRDDFGPGDHGKIARLLHGVKSPWLLSYDDCPEINRLYRRRKKERFSISYTAGERRRGREVLFAADNIKISRSHLRLLPFAGLYEK